MNKDQRKLISNVFPELAPQMQQVETNELLKSLIENMQEMKETKIIPVLKGDKGDKGENGIDLISSEELQSIKEEITPIRGQDYFNESDVQDFLKAVTPIKGIHYQDGESIEGPKGERGFDGRDGKDGSPDSPEQIANKLNTLEGVLNSSVIKDFPNIEDILKEVVKELKDPKGKYKLEGKDILNNNPAKGPLDMRWHGGGLSNITDLIQAGLNVSITGSGTSSDPYIISSTGGGSSGFQQPTSGVVNGVNDTFTWAIAPNSIVIDGVPRQKVQSDGTVNWTGTTTTVLTVVPAFDLFANA